MAPVWFVPSDFPGCVCRSQKITTVWPNSRLVLCREFIAQPTDCYTEVQCCVALSFLLALLSGGPVLLNSDEPMSILLCSCRFGLANFGKSAGT